MKQSALDFYDYYHLRGDSVHIDGTRSLKIPSGTTLQRPVTSSAMLRHNSQENWTEVGLDDTWMILVDRPNIGTFVNRSGDSMFGHLNMWQTAKIYNTDGNPVEPSYSFVNDTDTGLFRNTEDSMSVIVGGSIEQTPIVRFERFGSGQREKNTYFEGDVWIDEITFTRRGELKLDGDYAYFTGSNGLRLPQGTTAQRLPANRPVPVALTRYNSLTNNFEFGYADTFTEFNGSASNWGILSHKKDTSTWLVRKGDSMYGDIQMVQNARILLERGTASQPSLTFDVDKNTGLYKTPNGFSIAVESDILDTPVVSFERKDNNSHDGFNTYFQGDVWIDEITFTRKDSLKLDGDYAYFTGNRGLTLPRGNNANRFEEVGITRYNNEQKLFEMYHTDEWLQFSGRQDTDTYVNRKGDSIYGDLRFTNNARNRNTFGTATRPSITFNGREDIGFYTTGNSNISFSLDASVNSFPLFSADRYGTGNKERNFYLNSKLFVDEIVSNEFLFTSNKVTISGATGLRTAVGNTAQRNAETGIFRFNTDNDGFDLCTSDEWLVLSGNQDIDTYVNRKGDSIYGDLRFTDNSRSRHSFGTATRPSITFNGREDTGFYTTGNSNISFSLDASVNSYPLFSADRYGNGDKERNFYLNSKLFVDEIVSNEFLFTGNKVTISGATGLRTAVGNTAQRINETGIIRFNTNNDGFDLRTSDEWLVLSGNQDIDTYVNRKGDSIYGDLRFTTNARSRHSFGTVNNPSITFLGDEDTGLYRDSANSIGVVLGSSLNNTPVLHMTRNNNTNTGNTVTINGNLIVTGTASQINTTDTNILDNIITLNKNGTNVLTGIEVEIDGTIRGRLQYSYSTTEWSVDNNFISDVKYAVDPDHAVNKQFLDDVEDELRTEYTFLINQERDRAIAEEIRIEGKLDSEIDRSITRDDSIELALNNEITRSTTKDNQIETNLNNEITRSTTKDNQIETNLNSEIDRSITRDDSIELALNNEITRSTTKDNQIETNLNNEISRTTNEINRSTIRDDSIELALNIEITRATTRENVIENNLNSEISRTTSEINRSITRDDSIELALNSEITRATNRDDDLQQQIDSHDHTWDSITSKPVGSEGEVYYIANDGDGIETSYIMHNVRVTDTPESLETEKQFIVSFEDVFNTWYRFSHGGNNVFPFNPGETNQWTYNSTLDQVICSVNSGSHIGFVSQARYDNYIHEVTVSASGGDDDMLGVIVAFRFDDGDLVTNNAYNSNSGNYTWDINTSDPEIPNEHTITLVRIRGGIWVSGQVNNYGLVYNYGKSDEKIIANGDSLITDVAGTFANNPESRVRIVRDGDIITVSTTEWSDAPSYDGSFKGELVVDLRSDPDLEKFRGRCAYGYSARSQPQSTFKEITFIDPSGRIYDAMNDSTWYYNGSTWIEDVSASLQTEMGIGRLLRSINTGDIYFIEPDGSIEKIIQYFNKDDYSTTVQIESALNAEIIRATTRENQIETNSNNSIDTKVTKSGDTMTGNLSMSNNRITDVSVPVNPKDVVTLEFLENLIFDGGTF